MVRSNAPTMSALRRAMAPLLGVLVVLFGALLFAVASASPTARNAHSRPHGLVWATLGGAGALQGRAPATCSGAPASEKTGATKTDGAADPDELQWMSGPRDERLAERRPPTNPSAGKRVSPSCEGPLLADCHLARSARPPRLAPSSFAALEETASPVERRDSPRPRRSGLGARSPRGPPSLRPA